MSERINPMDRIDASTVFDQETRCRVWTGRTNIDGEPLTRLRGRWVRVKHYLTARAPEVAKRGFYPAFENTCGNKACITRKHLKVIGYTPK